MHWTRGGVIEIGVAVRRVLYPLIIIICSRAVQTPTTWVCLWINNLFSFLSRAFDGGDHRIFSIVNYPRALVMNPERGQRSLSKDYWCLLVNICIKLGNCMYCFVSCPWIVSVVCMDLVIRFLSLWFRVLLWIVIIILKNP